MPFIQSTTSDQDSALIHEAINYGSAFSVFEAKNSLRVYAVSDDLMLELNEKSISFKIVPESELEGLLTPKGFEAFRSHEPTVRSKVFNQDLPPLKCVRAHIICEEDRVQRIRHILTHMKGDILAEESCNLKLVTSEGETKIPATKLSFFLDRELQEVLYAWLQTEFKNPTSITSLTIEEDPDGPPGNS